ncbi:hypothetical protein Agub_g10406 [Astrephomene gubernaculifera]|uniref:Uncharacterized protein n=1 Tax=Astrephomene gubernaculifera TaxID=47775 RepID=A0AAD3HPP2_9CHLO|nr:hypothetical protein Agub_g10406 [Astrephomene gubernaculifera]
MRGSSLSLLTLLLVFGVCHGAKYNLTKTVQAPLVASHDPPDADCKVPGTCVAVNQSIPGQSLWYWCGFYSTHKTLYTLKSNHATNNFSTSFFMRKKDLVGCAIPQLATVENCPVLPESSCSGKKTCSVRMFGLVLYDETCFVIINNKAGAIVGTLQVNNFYDRPRYYGTVFTVLITVIGGLGIIGTVAYQFYTIIMAPVSKYREPLRPKRARDSSEKVPDSDKGGAADLEGGRAAFDIAGEQQENWLSRFALTLRSKLGRGKQSA